MKGLIQNQEQSIDLTPFATGIYIIKIGDDTSPVYRKIVKE